MTHQDKPRHLLETACFSGPSSLDDTEHNLRVMEEAIAAARKKGVQFLVFGEAFLTGFEGLAFNYWADSMKALALDGPEISRIRGWAKEQSMALAFGFHEIDDERIYSSYLALDRKGEIRGHYRRISKGWKPRNFHQEEYREGRVFPTFTLEGIRMTPLICGDLWEDHLLMDIIDRDLETDLFLWPVHCDYPVEEWHESIYEEYRERSQILARPVLFVNNFIEEEGRAKGGAYLWHLGRELHGLPYGTPGLLEGIRIGPARG